MYDRVRYAPRGTSGGGDGAAGAVLARDGRILPSKGRVVVESGEEVTLLLPGGGGFGPANERPPEAVAHDIEQGYLTEGCAERQYGFKQ
jgi:N-methylhydantoinase B